MKRGERRRMRGVFSWRRVEDDKERADQFTRRRAAPRTAALIQARVNDRNNPIHKYHLLSWVAYVGQPTALRIPGALVHQLEIQTLQSGNYRGPYQQKRKKKKQKSLVQSSPAQVLGADDFWFGPAYMYMYMYVLVIR